MTTYKALTKQQFAQDAEVTTKTLQSWLHHFANEMAAIGQKSKDKILSPAAVKILSEHYCVIPRNISTI